MEKKHIRKMISELKKQLSQKEIHIFSGHLTELFCELPEYNEAECIFAYMSYNQEVRTDKIIRRAVKDGKRVAVPKVVDGDMVFRYIESSDDCIPGYMGILEPGDDLQIADGREKKVLMIMPGLAFDPTGSRVGYGKGYYDRYLSANKNVEFTKIALCYDFQLLDNINAEEHDHRADIIISSPSCKFIRTSEGKKAPIHENN